MSKTTTLATEKLLGKIRLFNNKQFITILLLLLLLQLIIRLPSFFEPYWYGDEAIYLTIGQTLNKGAVLYKDIVNHKTPLIYYFARVGSQQAFRWELFFWMVVASWAFFIATYRITNKKRISFGGAVVFSVATALPAYEGLIPNGELFVMGFILIALALATLDRGFLQQIALKGVHAIPRQQHWWLLLAGISLSLAVLTKVPALFDALAFFFAGWLLLVDTLLPWSKPRDKIRPIASLVIVQWILLLLGISIPIIVSVLFFVWNGAGKEYLDFGLLYNFRYSQSWQPETVMFGLTWLTSTPFKFGFVCFSLLLLSLTGSGVSRTTRFMFGWFVLSLFAALLSNRPYPHYFLQIFPPLILLATITIAQIHTSMTKGVQGRGKNWHTPVVSLLFLVLALFIFWTAHTVVGMKRYPTLAYYQRFLAFASDNMSHEEYRNSFNWLTADNYAAATLINSSDKSPIFIWGTNPALYALTNRPPSSRFTVAFHIKDFHAEDEIINQLYAEPPEFIVVMHGEAPLIGLQGLLTKQYTRLNQNNSMVIYKLK